VGRTDRPPNWIKPQLTRLVEEAPSGKDWLHEIKYDGYRMFKKEIGGLRYSEHVAGEGPRFRQHACKLGLEGAISKLADRPYAPGDRGIWVKSKCLNREEFVVVGWTDPEGSRSHIGAQLLGYYTEDGLHYAGRAGTGIIDKELKRLAGALVPLQVAKMPLTVPRRETAAAARPRSSPKYIGCDRRWSSK
jgi:ATP-dependent DNA ligase